MTNQKVSTVLGIIIILIIAVTVGVFVYKFEKDNWRELDKVSEISVSKLERKLKNEAESIPKNVPIQIDSKLISSEDNNCREDGDCVNVMVECCDCGIEINKIYREKYDSAWKEKSASCKAKECVMDCYSIPRCVNGKCLNGDRAEKEDLIVSGSEEMADTSDWKTYRNEEYGFELKYPKECVLEEDNLANVNEIAIIDCHQREYFLTNKIPEDALYTGRISLRFYYNSSRENELEKLKKNCDEEVTSSIYDDTDFHVDTIKIGGNYSILNNFGCGMRVGNPSQLLVFHNIESKHLEVIGTISYKPKQVDITNKMLDASFAWIR